MQRSSQSPMTLREYTDHEIARTLHLVRQRRAEMEEYQQRISRHEIDDSSIAQYSVQNKTYRKGRESYKHIRNLIDHVNRNLTDLRLMYESLQDGDEFYKYIGKIAKYIDGVTSFFSQRKLSSHKYRHVPQKQLKQMDVFDKSMLQKLSRLVVEGSKIVGSAVGRSLKAGVSRAYDYMDEHRNRKRRLQDSDSIDPPLRIKRSKAPPLTQSSIIPSSTSASENDPSSTP